MCCCCVERPPPLASALASRSSAAIITATGEHSAELRLRRGQLQADSGCQQWRMSRTSGSNFFFRGFRGKPPSLSENSLHADPLSGQEPEPWRGTGTGFDGLTQKKKIRALQVLQVHAAPVALVSRSCAAATST